MFYQDVPSQIPRCQGLSAEPARIVKQMPGYNHVSWFPSRKNVIQIQCESRIERDLCYLLETNPSVLHYGSQTLKLQYFLNGKRRHTYPDFEVHFRHRRPCLIETKRVAVTCTTEFADKVDAIKAAANIYCAVYAAGYDYEVFTDTDIRESVAFANARELYRRGRYFSTSLPNPAVPLLKSLGGCVELHRYLQAAKKDSVLTAAIYAALIDGLLEFDRQSLLTSSSLIAFPALEVPS